MATKLLNIEEAAELLSVSVPTLRLWRYKGYGPKGATIGRRVMFRESDIEKWIAEQFAQVGA